jgi:hypothetical protein
MALMENLALLGLSARLDPLASASKARLAYLALLDLRGHPAGQFHLLINQKSINLLSET